MKSWDQLKKDLQETPLNVAGSSDGAIKGLGKPPEDGPPVKKKRKKFAGHEVFEVNSDEYNKCFHGRTKYERWSRKFDMTNLENTEIRKYAHRHPTKPIIIQNEHTGEMMFLRR